METIEKLLAFLLFHKKAEFYAALEKVGITSRAITAAMKNSDEEFTEATIIMNMIEDYDIPENEMESVWAVLTPSDTKLISKLLKGEVTLAMVQDEILMPGSSQQKPEKRGRGLGLRGYSRVKQEPITESALKTFLDAADFYGPLSTMDSGLLGDMCMKFGFPELKQVIESNSLMGNYFAEPTDVRGAVQAFSEIPVGRVPSIVNFIGLIKALEHTWCILKIQWADKGLSVYKVPFLCTERDKIFELFDKGRLDRGRIIVNDCTEEARLCGWNSAAWKNKEELTSDLANYMLDIGM